MKPDRNYYFFISLIAQILIAFISRFYYRSLREWREKNQDVKLLVKHCTEEARKNAILSMKESKGRRLQDRDNSRSMTVVVNPRQHGFASWFGANFSHTSDPVFLLQQATFVWLCCWFFFYFFIAYIKQCLFIVIVELLNSKSSFFIRESMIFQIVANFFYCNEGIYSRMKILRENFYEFSFFRRKFFLTTVPKQMKIFSTHIQSHWYLRFLKINSTDASPWIFKLDFHDLLDTNRKELRSR